MLVIDSLASSGGAEQAVAAMVPGLTARGVSCIVQPLQDKAGLAERMADAGANVLPPLAGGRYTQARTLVDRIHAAHPDLVHTTLFESDILGRPAARWARVPVVSSLVNVAYGPEQRRHLPAAKLTAARGIDAATARLVTRFHALTRHVRQEMGHRLRIPSSKIDVIPRGRDPKVLGMRTEARCRKTRERLGLLPGQVLIVSAARHEHQKGLDVALRALARVAAQRDDIVYVVAGRDGNATPGLAVLAAQPELAHRVRLLGARDDVPDLLAAADLFVAPSRWEGQGSAVVEAMALGAPLVVSDVPAIRETVGGESAALLVPPDDVDSLASGILQALGNEGEARDRARTAHRRFCSHFTLDVVLDQTLAFYDQALAHRRPALR